MASPYCQSGDLQQNTWLTDSLTVTSVTAEVPDVTGLVPQGFWEINSTRITKGAITLSLVKWQCLQDTGRAVGPLLCLPMAGL